MKKKLLMTLVVALTAVAAGVFIGCQSGSPTDNETKESKTEGTEGEAEDDSLQNVLDEGILRIGTEGTYPPFSYHDGNDKLVGYDVEVAEKIADKLDVKAEFIETKWDSMIAGLDAKRFDIIANQVEPTDERKEKYNFTVPYTYVHGALIVAADNDGIKDFSDLSGKQAAHSLTSNWAAKSEEYGAELVSVEGFEQAIELILAGRADFTINDDIAYYDYLKQKPDANIKVAKTEEDAGTTAIPVRKEDKALYGALNNALEELGDEGVLSELSEKYFGADVSQP